MEEEEQTQKITGGGDEVPEVDTSSITNQEEAVAVVAMEVAVPLAEEEAVVVAMEVAVPMAEVEATVVPPVPEEATVVPPVPEQTTVALVAVPIPEEEAIAVPVAEQETQQIIAEENIIATAHATPPTITTSESPTATEESTETKGPPPVVRGDDNEEEDFSAEDEEGEEEEETGGSKSCTICSKVFKRQSHLHRHMESLHGDGREVYHCPQCSSTFNRKDSLTRHLKSQHGENPRRFKCSAGGCDSLFNRKDHLNKHLRSVHKLEVISHTSSKLVESDEDDDEDGGIKLITPMITEVNSLSEPGLTKEDKMQVQDKRFKCSEIGCDQEYSNLDHLHRHLSRAHGGEMSIGTVLGHSIFGEGEMITDGYNETTLCMFCCKTFENNEELEKQRKGALASDRNFTKFCEAALRQQRKRMSANTIIKSLNGLERLSVCQKCFNKIGYAMSTKSAADEVDTRVAELRKQLDLELKNLQSEVDQFYVEMKMIEETIRNSDLSSLEGYLKNIEGQEEKEQSSVVLLLRDGIFAVMNDVEVYCRRVGGQTVVVNTPTVRKIGGGERGGYGDGKRGRKAGKRRSKGKINPLLHVKVECEEDEKNGEGIGGASGSGGNAVDDVVKSLGTPRVVEGTPRRQPVRVARVKTEEFFKKVFGGDEEDELDTVVKTEVESGGEEEDGKDGGDELVSGDVNEEGGKEKEDHGGEKKKEEEVYGNKKKVGGDGDGDGEEKAEEDGGSKEGGEDGGAKAGGEDGGAKKSTGPIEEILIDGDDLEDLFYVDEGESSDEDFNLDVTQDDLESVSESSEDTDEDSEEDEDDDTDDFISMPPKKKAKSTGGSGTGRGRPKGGQRKTNYDPFSFSKKSAKRSYKGPTTQSANKIASIYNIDFSNMSEFRKRLLCRMLKKSAKSKQNASTNQEPDPRLNFQYDYSPESQTLLLGDVPIIILDDHGSLQCSKCGYLASPAEKPRRSVPRLMYNHILGKHLFAFQCPQCSATLGSYRRYLDHIKGHQMGFMCDICGKPLFSEEALRRHRWGHQNAEEMADAINRGVKDPRRKYDPLQSFQCTTCGKVFAKKMLLRQHEKTHAENRERIVCQLCGKTFLPSGYISHQKYSCFPEGYEPPRVQCQMCPSTFKSVVLRARHMKYAHSAAASEKPFKCHICDKGFAANEHLQKHIKRHSDARPYLCRKGCGANYKTRKDCTRHEKKCEGNGTPMMRHKNRNDQLQAQLKQEPELGITQVPSHDIHIQQQGIVQPQQIIGHTHQGIVAGPAGTVVLQVHHQQQLQHQQQQQQQTTQIQQQQQPQHQQQQQQQPPQQFNVYNIL